MASRILIIAFSRAITPLKEVPLYLQVIKELGLKLVKATDTHVHADHVTGLGLLREQANCVTMMGRESQVECITAEFAEGDLITFGNLALKPIYTPGHTDDSYSFQIDNYVFPLERRAYRWFGRKFSEGCCIFPFVGHIHENSQ